LIVLTALDSLRPFIIFSFVLSFGTNGDNYTTAVPLDSLDILHMSTNTIIIVSYRETLFIILSKWTANKNDGLDPPYICNVAERTDKVSCNVIIVSHDLQF